MQTRRNESDGYVGAKLDKIMKRYVLVIDLRCLVHVHVGVTVFGSVEENVADSYFLFFFLV